MEKSRQTENLAMSEVGREEKSSSVTWAENDGQTFVIPDEGASFTASPEQSSICSLSINCSVAEFAHFVIAGDARGRTFVWQVPSTKLLFTLSPPTSCHTLGSGVPRECTSSALSPSSSRRILEFEEEGAKDVCCGCCARLSALNAADVRFLNSASRPSSSSSRRAHFQEMRAEVVVVPSGISAVGSVAEVAVSDDGEESDSHDKDGAAGSCGSDLVEAAENTHVFQTAQWLQAKPTLRRDKTARLANSKNTKSSKRAVESSCSLPNSEKDENCLQNNKDAKDNNPNQDKKK